MYRPKAGTLRAKQFKKFKLKKELKAVTRFAKKNIRKCYKIVAKQYFIKDHPISITQIY